MNPIPSLCPGNADKYLISNMNKYFILCVDTDPEILKAIEQDLDPLWSQFGFRQAKTIIEAQSIVQNQYLSELALVICDQVMPRLTGMEFLTSLNTKPETENVRKILLTAQVDKELVIHGLNHRYLDYYLAKPWNSQKFLDMIIDQLTTFVIKNDCDPLVYRKTLDNERILATLVENRVEKVPKGFLNYMENSSETLSKEIIQELSKLPGIMSVEKIHRFYAAGDIIIEENSDNEFLMFITKGEVVHVKSLNAGKEQQLLTQKEGSLVGLMSFVSEEKAFVSCYATTEVEVFAFDRKTMEDVMRSNPAILALFSGLLLQQLHQRLKKTIKVELKIQETLEHLDSTKRQMFEKEKMAVLGQLIAGIAHEINNPISAILRGAEHLKKSIPKIVNNDLSEPFVNLGSQVFEKAMTVKSLSTIETRNRTRKATSFFGSASIARKMVPMQLDQKKYQEQYFKNSGDQLGTIIDQLTHYYQTGNFLRNIDVCSHRIAELVKGLKNYTRHDNETMIKSDLREGLEDTLLIFTSKLKNYTVIKSYSPMPLVECYPGKLNQVWTNIISNAIDATFQKGKLIITTGMAPQDKENTEKVQISIEDDGHGVPNRLLEKIFKVNYTTKRGGSFGLGMGLALCKQIVQAHEGNIGVSSKAGKFTRFTIQIPVVSQTKKQKI